ncbi:ABC transporter permease [Reinekea marinisedimentorum]|uniref:Putative thiamine transport system permease protein n=1 Tax=Reinekea marinisedimentorum TaxID=230495 RepID=A0A4R3HZS6_9GAMM|nr:ABC transporter permease [Reinekea marinisedimentorum]TCS38203.1 putative thiamine transport system permease protein [Reinekea marinisedimentorum]
MNTFKRLAARGTLFGASPWITTSIFLIPVVVGLLGTWLPAFGWLPAIDSRRFSLAPWQQLFAYPGADSAIVKTLVTGLGASALALLITLLILIGLYPSKIFNQIERSLAPLLSMPHAAFAIGLGLLIMPSGWLVRLLATFTEALSTPPLWTTFQDAQGISLIFALALKEIPFLLFMSLAVLPTLKAKQTLALAGSLGHSKRYAWTWLLLPRLYKQIKLPFYAVVAYSLTVVDIAMIAGPTTPPTLAVLVNQWFYNPDFQYRMVGAAGATLLLLINVVTLLVLHLSEKPLEKLRTAMLNKGAHHRKRFHWETPAAIVASLSLIGLYIASILQILFWSFASRWRYPDLLPEHFSLRSWGRIFNRIEEPFFCSFWLAVLSAFIALVLTILMLENEVRIKQRKPGFDAQRSVLIVYLPLLIPQIAFLFGFQVFLIQTRLDANFYSLLWSHCVFVIPYVFLTLSGPYRKFDQRYSVAAVTLCSCPAKSFWKVKFQILLRPILYAFATGFSVSIAQYLPTLFVGAGKFSTITTEAVAMTSGSDRRLIAVMALWQQILPLIIFLLATLVPSLLFKNRKAMQQSSI